MKIVRRLIPALSFLMAFWVIASFAGVMVNAGDVGFWTTSLMWSLLASVIVMPGLVVAHHASKNAEKRAARKRKEESPDAGEERPFIEEEERQRTAWPVEGQKGRPWRE